MEQKIMENREKEIYQKYQETIAPYIMELEVRDIEYPIEIFNEIRAIFTHLARYKLQCQDSDLASAENHVKRAILDCYKYLCISIAESISKFREQYKTVDLKLADNGKFLPELDRLENDAKRAFKEAKKAEIVKKDENELYKLYEDAYNLYSKADKFIDDSHEAILFASSHSKKSNRINIISIVITVISILITFVTIFMAF